MNQDLFQDEEKPLIEDIPLYFICGFCKNLIQDPVTCSSCLTGNFCSKCAQTEISKLGKCPSCQSSLTKDNVAPYDFFLRRYNSEGMKCQNSGCKWQGKISEFHTHLEKCLVQCPLKDFGCKWKGSPKDLPKHWEDCQFLKKPNDQIFLYSRISSDFCILILFLCFFISWWQSHLWGGKILPWFDCPRYSLNNIKPLKERVEARIAYADELRLNYLTKSNKVNGFFTEVYYDSFIYSGFKLGLNATFSQINSAERISPYRYKDYVLLGVRKKNTPILILAGVGRGSTVISESYSNSCHLENKLCWYFSSGKSFGFAYDQNNWLDGIDFSQKEGANDAIRLLVSLNGTSAGRVGNQIISEFNNNLDDYELVILYLDRP